MSEAMKRAYQRDFAAEEVSKRFDEIDRLLGEMIELGASNQRMKMGMRHLVGKYVRER